ncbi:protein atonal homolog 8, partial [Gracilinanus agilis]|uniref:protein atonal homolog 8 n=1 Tax=Gracilinanus agilis TaxID=191870 RepID=UPI001CFEDAC6
CPPPPRQPAPQPQPPPPPAPQPQPQPPAPQPRPAGSSFSSISHVIYTNNPEASASPRKRLGESAGVSSEIKAIQQTRRLLANARERTRVHTISAAFEALRKQVPCYSYGQKLSKLAILRIACNYILSLARLADLDYSADHSNMSFSECVEQCTRTLQAEGRSKKRKVGSGSHYGADSPRLCARGEGAPRRGSPGDPAWPGHVGAVGRPLGHSLIAVHIPATYLPRDQLDEITIKRGERKPGPGWLSSGGGVTWAN